MTKLKGSTAAAAAAQIKVSKMVAVTVLRKVQQTVYPHVRTVHG